ncbi:ATP-dependent helicase [bacterium]|nr:ATP-dependent helicase [bacterium]
MSKRLPPNEDQQRAIDTINGPVLIIAGPGSGKTFTLVERVYHLLADEVAAPENIFIATFTEKAARELITRISNRVYEAKLKVNINDLCVGTLHSIFLNILEEFRDYTRLKRNYSIWDQFDQQYMIYKNIYKFRSLDDTASVIGSGGLWKQAGTIASWVNKVSEEALSVSDLEKSTIPAVHNLAAIYRAYEELLEEQNALDFSKIQYELLMLLENNPEVLEILRTRYKYFMIDEYQDTNSIQERIILKMLNPEQNICVVGDDDQGLYRFRGATIRNILEFEHNFDHCTRIELTKNYRSHSGIIDFYNNWMKQQDWAGETPGEQYRFDKMVVADPDTEVQHREYPSVLRVSATGSSAWCEEIVEFLKDMHRRGIITDLNQVVFLFRSVRNPHAIELSNYLESKKIHVYSPRSNLFFQREEIQLAVGAICVLYYNYFEENEFDIDYKRYIESCIIKFKDAMNKDGKLRDFVHERIQKHAALEKHSLDYALSGLFYKLFQFDVFAKYLGDNAVANIHDGRPARNLARFTQMLTKFEYLENINVFTAKNIGSALKKFYVNYLCFLYGGGIEEYEDESEYAPSGFVSFMTIHQSKGLQFPVVFVCSLWESPRKQYTELDEILQSTFYHKKPFEPIEETKNFDFMRLYYTAYSRAQNLLCLSCPEQVQGHRIPSRKFIESYSAATDWRSVTSAEYARIELDKIKPTNIKNEYAFTSHILVYENCPVQYKFFKELGFAKATSYLVHWFIKPSKIYTRPL